MGPSLARDEHGYICVYLNITNLAMLCMPATFILLKFPSLFTYI